MLPCSPSSLSPCATFASKNLALVTYLIVYHAVRFPLVLRWETFRSTYSTYLSGHVLCLSCCTKILDTTPPSLVPTCPFCREQFSRGTVRLIRIDLNRVTPTQVHRQRKSKGVYPTIFPSVFKLFFFCFPHIHAQILTFLNSIEHDRS
jgi:hypothetical protein